MMYKTCFAFYVLIMSFATLTYAQPKYQLYDLGSFVPLTIANDGTMGGVINPSQHAARGQAADIEDLGIDGNVYAQTTTGLSAEWSGCFDGTCPNQTATTWTGDGTRASLGLQPGGLSSVASCISKVEYTGYGLDATVTAQPLIFSNGTITEMPTLGNGGYIDGCNSTPQRVGLVITPLFLREASLWDASGNLHLPGTLGGSQSGFAAINASGEAVGWSTLASGEVVAMRWTASAGMQELPSPTGATFCQAFGLNRFGTKVGICDFGSVTSADRAALWSSGTMQGVNINSLTINGASGWTLESARSVNDWGMIVGSGTLASAQHGFLLVPQVITRSAGLITKFGL
jgi:hypothetical protein